MLNLYGDEPQRVSFDAPTSRRIPVDMVRECIAVVSKKYGKVEPPLKKPKKMEASAEETRSDEKLAAEMDKRMGDPTHVVEEDGEIEDRDGEEDEGNEVLVVEENRREDMNPTIKARKNARRVV